MIEYAKVKVGDILRVIEPGLPDYAEVGELVKVTEVEAEGLWCMNSKGERGGVVFACGAARLEMTEFENEQDVLDKFMSQVQESET